MTIAQRAPARRPRHPRRRYHINTELGFQPYSGSVVWQVDIEHVLEYLGTAR